MAWKPGPSHDAGSDELDPAWARELRHAVRVAENPEGEGEVTSLGLEAIPDASAVSCWANALSDIADRSEHSRWWISQVIAALRGRRLLKRRRERVKLGQVADLTIDEHVDQGVVRKQPRAECDQRRRRRAKARCGGDDGEARGAGIRLRATTSPLDAETRNNPVASTVAGSE